MQITIGENTYDGDVLQSLADRDTPAAIIAQAALRVGEVQQETGDRTTSHALGD